MIPDDLLLTETDNPGAIKWLKKNDEMGMPVAINNVVRTLVALRGSTANEITRQLHANFARLVGNDPGLDRATSILSDTA